MSILQRLRNNIEAIKYALTGRGNASALDMYSGFGGIGAVLYIGKPKEQWPKSMLPYWDEVRNLVRVIVSAGGDMEGWVASLKSSTLTAYYTPKKFAAGIAVALNSKLLIGDRVLDPAAGSGAFINAILDWCHKDPSKIVAYEKDLLTGAILNARMKRDSDIVDVRVNGFETIPKEELGTYDLVTTNVPFGDFAVYDPDYTVSKDAELRKAAKYIHRYYVLKGLDCLRDGGIEAYIITSNYLNHDFTQIVKALEHARLIGAYRLPNNLFKEADTEVGTDLLVLQKDEQKGGLTVDETMLITPYTEDGCYTNMYFVTNPDHVIATHTEKGTDAYGKPTFIYKYDGDEKAMADAMRMVLSKDLADNVDFELYKKGAKKKEASKQEKTESKNRYRYTDNETGDLIKAIAEVYNKLFVTEATTFTEDTEDRKQLNELYDKFVAKHGAFNRNPFNNGIVTDIARELLSLEVKDGKQWVKSDIFRKPVAFDTSEIHGADTPQEALAQSLNDYGYPDVEHMMALTGLSETELMAKLDGDVYYNPLTNQYEIAAKFVSGNVVEKAKAIRTAYGIDEEDESDGKGELTKTIDPRVMRSLRALEDAVPTPIPFEELDFNLGERWIDTKLYEQFGSELFSIPGGKGHSDQVDLEVKYDANLDQFVASAENYWNEKVTTQYFVESECSAYNGIELFVYALEDTCPKMWKYKRDAMGCKETDGNGRYIKEEDPEKTQLANTKIAEIRNAWVDWLMRQPRELKDQLAKEYNSRFNCFVKPHYDGSHQRFPGLDRKALEEKYGVKDLYQSQKDCIWMLVQNQGGICDHEVGSGKTLIMCIAAHEMKRLGIVHKPMIIGLKANVGAIAETYQTAYPNAKILYAQNKDFHESERVNFFNRMKNNDYDCIIMSHDQFGRLPQSKEVQRKIILNELKQLEDAMNSAKDYNWQNSRVIMRGLERRKKNLEANLAKLVAEINEGKDDVSDFEMMGIDHIFVDESHMFKNLGFTTRHSRVAGLGNTEGSKRAFNLLVAIRTIQKRTGRDLGATFLSGTTVTNSLTELYSFFRYLRPMAMAKQGITCFDAWAAIFTKKSTEFEFSITNQIIMKERFRYFIKVPELAQFYNEITDFRTAEDVGIERPKKHARLLNIEPTPDQQEYTQTLMEFAKTGNFSLIGMDYVTDAQQKAKMLYATDLARKMSLDMRMIDSSYPDHPRSKSSMCAKLVKQYYDKYDSVKGTQLIFSDLSTYQGKNKGWNVYEDIKQKLVEMGIPSSEIRFIQECKNDTAKAKMVQDVNDGKVRVLFGSTSMLGTGVNAQKRVVAVHHLDTPWRPSDLEQRDGRAIRKGNEVAKLYADNTVDVIIYAVRRSLDAYKFGLLNNKQLFISQLKRGQLSVRTLDEGSMDEKSGMNFAEYMAVLSGNTDLLERAKLEKRVAALESERKAFYRDKSSQTKKQERLREDNERNKKNIADAKSDLEKFNAVVKRDEDGRPINLIALDGFTPYAKGKDGKLTDKVLTADDAGAFDVAIGEQLIKIDRSARTGGAMLTIGNVYGFPISVKTKQYDNAYDREVEFENNFYVSGQRLVYAINNGHGNINRVAKGLTGRMPVLALNRLPEVISGWEQLYDENESRIKQLDAIIQQPWGKDAELTKLRTDLADLDAKISKSLKEDKQKGEQKAA